eukprot:7138-Heterococcus_DN1.PRE.4
MLALLLLSLAARCAVALLVAPVAPYLVHWRYGKSGAHEYFSSKFRQEEFRSLAALAGAEPTSITFSNAIAGSGEDAEAIQWISGLPTEAVAAAICRRAVCVRALHTLLAEGVDLKSCADEAGKLPTDSPHLAPLMAGSSAVSAAAFICSDCIHNRLEVWLIIAPPSSLHQYMLIRTAQLLISLQSARCAAQTWCARVRRFENGKFGRALRSPLQSEERADVNVFEELLEKLPGPVRLRNPQHTLFILSGPFVSSSLPTSANTEQQQQHSTDTAEPVQHVLLTRQLCEGFNPTPYALPTRRFLSTTTMEHEAAFVMANQARITSGMSVLDPYAGSGGLLLTAAVAGAAVTVGIEMDKRLRYKQLNSNFEQQQLPPLTALIHGDSATAAVQEQALQANGGRPFDVILTDPPY